MTAIGFEVISTWIDEAEQGQSNDLADLANCCITEAAAADCLILYSEEDEVLKSTLIEAGAALAQDKAVYTVGPCVGAHSAFRHHPQWFDCDSAEQAAIQVLSNHVGIRKAATA